MFEYAKSNVRALVNMLATDYTLTYVLYLLTILHRLSTGERALIGQDTLLVTTMTVDTLERARPLVTDWFTRLAAVKGGTYSHTFIKILFTVPCRRHAFNIAFFVFSLAVARLKTVGDTLL